MPSHGVSLPNRTAGKEIHTAPLHGTSTLRLYTAPKPAAKGRRAVGSRPFRRLIAASAAAMIATSLAACATVVNGTPHIGNAPNAHLHVVGETPGSFDTTVQNALADIEAFWRRNYPKISGGKPLPPLKGGLYSVSGLRVAETGTAYSPIEREKCIQAKAGFIVDNAAYCLLDDSIAWDRSPQHLFAQLAAHYGKLMIALVFAHEFGHAISARLGVFKNNPPTI